MREEKDSDDGGVNNSTDIVSVLAGDRSNCLLGIDLFGRVVQGRATGNAETDSTGNRVKCYNSAIQTP